MYVAEIAIKGRLNNEITHHSNRRQAQTHTQSESPEKGNHAENEQARQDGQKKGTASILGKAQGAGKETADGNPARRWQQ